MNLSALDLNRLVVLHVALEERSVTRAAARLHVTPSAVSNTLAQLRDTFGDALLVRSGRGLALTPRAVALVPLLAQAVAAASRVVEAHRPFDPRESTRTFSLACSDAEQIAEAPRIAAAVAAKLPRATLRIVSVEQLEAAGGLAASDIDAAIAPASGAPAVAHYALDLYADAGVLVVRRDHPRVRGGRMSKALFNELRHVDILLALGRGGIGHRLVEDFLAANGLCRDVAATAPSFTAAAAIVSNTDWVTGMPRRLARRFVAQMPLRVVSMPVPPLSFQMQLVWHERTQSDEGAQFFRALVVAAVRALKRR